jgi:hypothetical protein
VIQEAVRLLDAMPPDKQRQAVKLIRSLQGDLQAERQARVATRRGLIGTIPEADCAHMIEAINEAFGQVEDEMWK